MIFIIFRDFFPDFSNFIFDLIEFKTMKKRGKRDCFLRGSHVGATWHTRPRGRATQAHATQYLYLSYIVYNIYRSPDYRETNLLTLLIAALYIPDSFCLFLPCGTMFHTFSFNCRPRGSTSGVGSAAPWKSARRSRGREDHRSIIAHVPFKRSYNGHDFTRSNASEALDHDPTDTFSRVL